MRWDRSSTKLRRWALVALGAFLGVIVLIAYGCSRGSDSSENTSQEVPGGTMATASISPALPGSSSVTPAPIGSGTSSRAGKSISPRPANTATAVPWEAPRITAGTPPKVTPSAPAGRADLTILLDDGFGVRATWTLTCDPAGGNHPSPSTACGVLGASGAKALPAPPTGQMCTQEYGGPQKALIRGTWRGKAISSQLTLENGCEISRWSSLLGLLPAGGTP
ncbi:MAG: hypothetical protein QG608_90 [Actinomycetota bacterium]|nr:hypothetical protein [Actinomycetota bacterium]